MGPTIAAAPAALDNPVWHALEGPQRRFAGGCADTRWYPADVAPFAAIPHPKVVPALDEALAGGMGSPVYLVGVLPAHLPHGWAVVTRSRILQLLPVATAAAAAPTPEDDLRLLGAADAAHMLELMRIGFPDFYRARTAELGEYLGIVAGPQLCAMAGERLALDGWQEISGVCTHPSCVGRGYARRLTQALMQRQRDRGVRSFLHVSEGNERARRLYAAMGFVERASLPFTQVARRNP